MNCIKIQDLKPLKIKKLIDLIRRDYINLSLQILSAGVTFLVAVSAWLYYSDFIYKQQLITTSIILLIISFILQMGMIFFKVKSDSHMITYAEKLKIEDELKSFKERLTKISEESRQLNCLSYIVHISAYLLNTFYHSNERGEENEESFKAFLTAIIYKVFFTSIQAVFEKDCDEYFSVAIYLYDGAHNLLWDFGVGGKDKQIHHQYKPGRLWHLNDNGHVCHCFRTQQELIHDNIEEQIKAVKLGPRFPKADDSRHYKSAITLPIFVEGNAIRGVFCITSNKINCFRRESISKIDEIKKEYNELDYILDTKINLIRILNEVVSLAFNMFYGNNTPNAPESVLSEPTNKEYLEKINN